MRPLFWQEYWQDFYTETSVKYSVAKSFCNFQRITKLFHFKTVKGLDKVV